MSRPVTFEIDGKLFSCETNLSINTFTVKSVPKSYSVTIEEESSPFNAINRTLSKNPKNVLLIDERILDIYQPQLNISAHQIVKATATEDFKSLNGVTRLIDFLQQHAFTKNEQLIVVGGGIIQDVGAFASAVYKRGIPWIHFPTTLLSMSDSCIGGKTGINYNHAKNQLALFSAPSTVMINTHFLKTLDQTAITSGLGEILKLCITGGEHFITLYNAHVGQGKVQTAESFRELILAALMIKKTVVEEDEFELNHRKSMNYGHTVGHAVEALSDYHIPHGQAVVIGMIIANELSHELNLLSNADRTRLNALCFDLLNDDVLDHLKKVPIEKIIETLQKDKKTLGQITSFVLIKSPGNTQFIKLELNQNLMLKINNAFNRVLNRE